MKDVYKKIKQINKKIKKHETKRRRMSERKKKKRKFWILGPCHANTKLTYHVIVIVMWGGGGNVPGNKGHNTYHVEDSVIVP